MFFFFFARDKKRQQTLELRGHAKKVNSLDFNASGAVLASASADQTVRVWDIERAMSSMANGVGILNCQSSQFQGHQEAVEQVRFNAQNDNEFVTVSCDKTVKFWDVRLKKCVDSIQTVGENVSVAWSPNGKTVCVGARDDTLTFIDCTMKKTVKNQQTGADVQVLARKPVSRKKFVGVEVNEFAWDREIESNKFFVLTGDGKIQCNIWDEQKHTIKNVHEFLAHTAGCYCIHFDPSQEKTHFAVGSADAVCTIWNIPDGYCCFRTVDRHETPVRAVAFSHDGKFLATASEDDFIDICDPVSSKRACEPIFVRAPMNALAWHPKVHALAYAGDNEDLSKRKRDALNLDEDLDTKASRIQEEEAEKDSFEPGDNDPRDENRRWRSAPASKPNKKGVEEVEGLIRLFIPKVEYN